MENKLPTATTFLATNASQVRTLPKDRLFWLTVAMLAILLAFIVLFPLRAAGDSALYLDIGGRVRRCGRRRPRGGLQDRIGQQKSAELLDGLCAWILFQKVEMGNVTPGHGCDAQRVGIAHNAPACGRVFTPNFDTNAHDAPRTVVPEKSDV